ncbi:MAG: glycosyltransferase family 4 protein [Pseudomonadota bacterium]
MHIFYLHQYFNTRSGYTGTRSYEFARHLVKKGHQVTLITSGKHATKELSVPAGQEYFELDIEGIHVVPIAAAYNSPHLGTAMGGIHRMLAFLEFAALATRVGLRLKRPDIVFATHTPLTIGLPGIALARHFGVPFVFEVRDLWPQALINCGALKDPLTIFALRCLERGIYNEAQHIVALSPGMKAGVVSAGIPPEHVTVIPNSSDLDLFQPNLDGTDERNRLGLADKFAAIYFGAMGLANGLEYAIEAARILKNRGDKNIFIVLHGDGGRRPFLENLARSYGLDNLVFSNPVPDKLTVAKMVAACNACLTIYAATDKEQTWSPNKMFDALAAGRPVLINVPGWLGETIQQNDCGYCVDPSNPVSLANALQELAADPEKQRQMGKNARALAEREFARGILADRLEQILLTALEQIRLSHF